MKFLSNLIIALSCLGSAWANTECDEDFIIKNFQTTQKTMITFYNKKIERIEKKLENLNRSNAQKLNLQGGVLTMINLDQYIIDKDHDCGTKKKVWNFSRLTNTNGSIPEDCQFRIAYLPFKDYSKKPQCFVHFTCDNNSSLLRGTTFSCQLGDHLRISKKAKKRAIDNSLTRSKKRILFPEEVSKRNAVQVNQ